MNPSGPAKLGRCPIPSTARSHGAALPSRLLPLGVAVAHFVALPFPALAEDAGAARTPLATVNGRTLYVDEVEGALAFRIFQHELDIYSLLAAEAERRIEAEVLADAARARGLSVEALLAELEGGARGDASAVSGASPAEIDRYLAEHPPAPGADPAAVRERVAQYLTERARLDRRIAGLAALREAAGARVLLAAPVAPRTDFEIGASPTRGPASAPVSIVHFASLGSRAGARSAENLMRLVAERPGEIRWTHVHLLAERDEAGLYAARLAVAAHEAGRFWPFHDAVVAARLGPAESFDAKRLDAIAAQAGLPARAIREAGTEGGRLAAVKADIDRANAAGIPREPGLFVNGLFVSGLLPYEELRELVRRETRAASESPR
ncbi:MAG: thioredoxin domain-containing protein [Deltaproteobacteria bacterium]|nr:thioredoxin domain-containing protein [Deltaproteobacteria bacterium]